MSNIVKDLQANFMLVGFVQSTWSARVDDPTAARRAEKALGAARGSRKAAVNVLAGNDAEYRAVINAIGRARKLHEELTFSWGGRQRALHMSKYMDYMQAMGKAIAAFQNAKDRFIDAWDANIAATKAAASQDRADLINYYAYPSKEAVNARFAVRLEPCPISGENNFPAILQGEGGAAVAQAYKNSLSRKMRAAIDLRMHDLAMLIENAKEKFVKVDGDRAPKLMVNFLEKPLEKIAFLREAIPEELREHYAAPLGAAYNIFSTVELKDLRGSNAVAAETRRQMLFECERWLETAGTFEPDENDD